MKNRNKVKELAAKLCSKVEDIFLELVLLLPDQFVLAKFLERYLEKRTRELEQQRIKADWQKIYLKEKIFKYRGNE